MILQILDEPHLQSPSLLTNNNITQCITQHTIYKIGGWSSQILNEKLIQSDKDERNGRWYVGYLATVRVTLLNGVSHEDVGSGEGISQFYVCFGKRKACLQSDRTYLQLSHLSSNGDRDFFMYSGRLALSGVDYLTLIGADDNGHILGSRLVKVFTK